MLQAKQLLAQMVEHLSDWLIIRRNPEQTSGGKLLLGFAEEIESLNDAIKAYVDSFFLSNYRMQLHAIACECMRLHAGEIDLSAFKLIKPHEIACNCMQTHENACECMQLHAGYLYFDARFVKEGETIVYQLHDKIFEGVAERVPIWNVFDEFALYVGIERMDRETNESLFERILFQSQHPVNSSEQGIKHAIMNITALSEEAIIIEAINETNCFQNDYTGEVLFDRLLEINRDIYRLKRWGIDYWHRDIDTTHYIPHTYDIAPSEFQDGIGDNDDLKVAVTKKDESVHLIVDTYIKDEEVIEEYHKKYPSTVDTVLKLYRPEDIIEPVTVDVQIEASTITAITDFDCQITYEAIRSVYEKERLTALINTEDFDVIYPVKWLNNNRYYVKIKPSHDYASFHANFTINNQSFIKEQDGFYLNEAGFLTHSQIALYANQLYYFNEHIDFKHRLNGFKLSSQSRSGKLVLPLRDMNKKDIHFEIFEPAFDLLDSQHMSYQYFDKLVYENVYVSQKYDDPFFAIRKQANCIQFDIEGSAVVILRDSEGDKEYTVTNTRFTTEAHTFTPKDFIIHIIPSDTTEEMRIKDIVFYHYTVQTTLEKGEIENNQLPDYDTNHLTIQVETFSSDSPTIGFIYIGDPVSNLDYTSEEFVYTGQPIHFGSPSDDMLFEIYNLTANTCEAYRNNAPTLTARTSGDYFVNLASYSEVNDVLCDSDGEMLVKDGFYYLRVKEGQTYKSLIIEGEKIDYRKDYKLSELIHKKQEAAYYLSPLIDGFIESLYGTEYALQALLPHTYGRYTAANYAPFTPVFKAGSQLFEVPVVNAPITHFFLKANDAQIYKAFNKFYVYQEQSNNMKMDKNFSPLLPIGQTMLYKITTLNDYAHVSFCSVSSDVLDTNHYSSYSIDTKPLTIQVDFTLINQLAANYEEFALPIRLDKRIVLPTYIKNAIGDTLDLSMFLITPEEGIEVFYAEPYADLFEEDPKHFQTEKFILNESGIKKLNYCNIYEVTYCSFERYEENSSSVITEYLLIDQLGILKFNDYFATNNAGRIIYVHYTIKIPKMLILSTDRLYDTVLVTYEAYKQTATEYHVAKVGVYQVESESFNTCDYVTVHVEEPGYIATPIIEKSVIHITESIPRDRIVIKKGFYYIDDKEYYLLGLTQNSHEVFTDDYIEPFNIKHMEEGLMLHSQSENYLLNSTFETSELNMLFTTQFEELQSINQLKRFNACEQLNIWETYNSEISLDDSPYTKGVRFQGVDHDHIHFIGMPIQQTGEDLVLSFWLEGDATPLIYEQQKSEDESHLTLTHTKAILNLEKENAIYSVTLPYKPDIFYYLYLSKSGIIDDLILCRASDYHHDYHTKNIDKIFMPQFQTEDSGRQRLLFHHQKAYKGSTEMTLDGDIVPTSNMSYGYTSLLEKDWMLKASKTHVAYENNCLIPKAEDAYFLTPIVYIPSVAHAKELVIRANHFHENDTPLVIYAGHSKFDLKPIVHNVFNHDVIHDISKIGKYIQVQCNLKHLLYSLDISVKYKEGAIPETFYQNLFESEIFDLSDVAEYELELIHFLKYNQAQLFVRSGVLAHLMDDYVPVSLSETGALLKNHQLGFVRYIQFKLLFINECNLEYFDVIKKERA